MIESCPECGLTFKDGKRTFSTFGNPVITLEKHLGHHGVGSKRAAELLARMASYNARAEAHQPTEELCDKRSAEAEAQPMIHLPVVAPSRTTDTPSGKGVRLPADLEIPGDDQLRKHADRFGSSEVAGLVKLYGAKIKLKQLVDTKPSRRRRTTPELRAQVLDMHKRGIVPAAIADSLNISDARVAGILVE